MIYFATFLFIPFLTILGSCYCMPKTDTNCSKFRTIIPFTLIILSFLSLIWVFAEGFFMIPMNKELRSIETIASNDFSNENLEKEIGILFDNIKYVKKVDKISIWDTKLEKGSVKKVHVTFTKKLILGLVYIRTERTFFIIDNGQEDNNVKATYSEPSLY